MAIKLQLVITVDDKGQVQVTGPIHDRLLCYGLLEAARDAIKEHNDNLAKSSIVPARPADVLELRKLQ
jgi:hypothetical protein